MEKYKIEILPIPTIPSYKDEFEILVDYLIFLNDITKPQINPYTENDKLAPVFEEVLNMCVYELYFTEHMKDEEIDIIQYINMENHFRAISGLSSDNEKKFIIRQVYSKLQEQDNVIRNRIISSNIKSRNIIRRINSTTH